MSQVDRPELTVKPEPFLTLQISAGDAGTYVKCNELGVGLGIGGSDTRDKTVKGINDVISGRASILLNRAEAGTLPEDVTPEQLDIAKRIVEAEKNGIAVADLIRPQ